VNEELVSYLSLSFEVGKWETPGPIEIETVPVENHRKSTRYDAREPFPVYEQKSYRQIGLLTNLSTAGVSMTTPKPVEKGRILNCRAKLPKTIFQRDYLMFDAECMWCRKNEDEGWFESGHRLKKVSEHDAVIILHLIIHVLDEQPKEQRVRVIR
jgi:hypothetical protein